MLAARHNRGEPQESNAISNARTQHGKQPANIQSGTEYKSSLNELKKMIKMEI